MTVATVIEKNENQWWYPLRGITMPVLVIRAFTVLLEASNEAPPYNVHELPKAALMLHKLDSFPIDVMNKKSYNVLFINGTNTCYVSLDYADLERYSADKNPGYVWLTDFKFKYFALHFSDRIIRPIKDLER